jgi:hypothetical protein
MSIPEADLTINTTPAGLLGKPSEDEYATVRHATWRGIPVAAKTLPLPSGHGPFLALDKEIEVLSCLRHPHLVPVFGVCHHPDGCTTLVEELVPGDTLYSRLHTPALALACPYTLATLREWPWTLPVHWPVCMQLA